ncbi:MAG: hypothetical protein KKB21_04840 [Nanoarchaeota archaeon]|nr:hypothetical protein [Nanoarchaeota archaeon]MBU4086873.1 hypothetical protein [Nanoarchaeota archaeon]
MPRCPNCNYSLVLLSHRRKYKCAKCGKLFWQKEVEVKEFQEFNKRERKQDKETINGKPQKQVKLTEFERKQKSQESAKRWRENNKEKIILNQDEHYQKNRDRIITQKREYRKGLSGQQRKEQNEKRKARRWQNIEETRLITRINYWRLQQKALALRIFENRLNSLYNLQLQQLLPTILLS